MLTRMKILIHALGVSTGGAARHLTNFLPEIGIADPDRNYTILVRSSFSAPDPASANIRLERIPERASRSWVRRLIYDLWILPRKLKREGYDAIVSLTNSGPIWSPVPHILFQRNPIFYCSYYLKDIRGRVKLEMTMRRWHAMASMSRATVTVTPSNAMSHMIRVACPGIRHRRMVTLYHGFDQVSLADPLDPDVRTQIDRVRQPRLLYATHVAQHKGFDVLFETLVALRARGKPVGLVVAGRPEDWPEGRLPEKVKALGLQDTVVFLGGVAQRQMGNLYRSCDLVVNPSLCESFGFSMIEALGHELPVVAADLPISREICGDAALYYPPLDAQKAADRIADILEKHDCTDFKQAARIRLQQFDWTWRRYAREFVSLIDSVLAVPRGKMPSG